MDLITGMLPYFVNPRFILLCLAGSVAGAAMLLLLKKNRDKA